MASIDRGKLISKLGYVAYFNERVWGTILATAGNVIHHRGGATNLNQDKMINVSMDAAGKVVKTGEYPISLQGMPVFSSTAYAGANTLSGYVFLARPVAMRPEHLKNINGNQKQYFTLSDADLDAKARALGKDPKLVVADVVYSCCFDIIRSLISIRPFTASWQHTSSVANRSFTERYNGGGYAYGVFEDYPYVDPSWGNLQGSGGWGAGGALSRWQITLGGNISALRLTEASVARVGIYTGSKATASNAVNMVSSFWNAWAERCRARNSFDYKFFSCHLNCHASCHSSCHGSRSRR